jgi:uncharacterized FAD-dependent dehydrogenase
MKALFQLKLSLKQATDEAAIKQAAAKESGWKIDEITVVPIKRSIDARGRIPIVLLQVEVYKAEKPVLAPPFLSFLQAVHTRPSVLIVGAGPAGYFAALELIELGFRPIVLDRGKDVQTRRRDLKAIQQDGIVNPHSNYCFGEGGAGTYSDGKLYTRSVKRGNWWKVLSLLVEHGADSDILVEAHPHIGSNKLPKIVAAIRETIQKYGGEVHFNAFVTDFIVHKGKIEGVIANNETAYKGEAVILATGHSARDIYTLLHQKGIQIEAKPFALGVRIEHPQALIDEVQYKQKKRDDLLPAAPYKLVCQVEGRGVFSFCMCPGGLVVPAATAPGEIVVNGMSMSRRDSKYANSGTVTSVELHDLAAYHQHGVFAGMAFQAEVEQAMFQAGDGSQKAPAQRLTDFVKGKVSNSLPDTSYIPGVFSASLHQLLPPFIAQRLMTGVKEFGKQMRGYYTDEAVVIGTESRTSSPIRIPRDPVTLQHTEIIGLFPCGEGAGFAGGILSAAMDGQNVAKAVAAFLEG